MDQFLQAIQNSITTGSLYALIALGYTMVYGILKFINFSHSDVVVIGALFSTVLALTLLEKLGLQQAPWWLGGVVLAGAMALCATVSFLVERLAYRPLRQAPRLNCLITAIGVSLFLQNTGNQKFLFGTQPRKIPALVPDAEPLFMIGKVPFRLIDFIIVGTAVVLMVALDRLVFKSAMGRAMRAVSFDHKTASLMGINVDRVISMTFVLGACLAAAGGFLYALRYQTVTQPADTTWALLGLKAFVSAVVGGIGNIRGAVLGALIIASIENFGAAYLFSGLTDAYVFAVLIGMLLLRPGGILGSAAVEKV
ncbi:MAG: branched-chain amino acid ABC transporter permease [Phycisphaeraceae bacterium]|nr:MAG: branched-chain amino acid ABC transporter permease [Phycisphaeraceae bacterium]